MAISSDILDTSVQIYDLTQSQSLIWTGQQINNESPMYNMAFTFEIDGVIDISVFKEAFAALIVRSDVMRSTVRIESGVAKICIQSILNYDLKIVDHSSVSQQESKKWIKNRCKQIFNLENILFDSVLIKKSACTYIWMLNQHHLITDGLSKTIHFEALSLLYEQLSTGTIIEEIKLPSYTDYLQYERAQRLKPRVENTQYWEKVVQQIDENIATKISRNRATTPSVRRTSNIEQTLIKQLTELVNEPDLRSWTADISMFTVFTSILAIILSRNNNTDQVVIGVPVSNRQNAAQKKTLGLFMELFPMIIEVKNDDTFLSLYNRTRTTYFDCLKHAGSGVSSVEIATTIPVIVNYMNGKFGSFAGMPTRAEWIFVDHVDPGHAIRLQISDFEGSGAPKISFDLNTSVYNPTEQEELIVEYSTLIRDFVNDRNRQIISITDTEQEILQQSNKIDVGYPKDKTIADLFEDQVRLYPNKTAVKDRDQVLTYLQVDIKANQIANYLEGQGVQEGTMIALYLDRSLEMIPSILAIVKLGCTYVPIDPTYPTERVAYMLADCGAEWVLTTNKYVDYCSQQGIQIVDVNAHELVKVSETSPSRNFDFKQPLYVIYTSGSTGKPKGVVISHENVIRLFFNDAPVFDFDSDDVWTMFHSYCFDVSVWEMYGALLNGGELVIVPQETVTNPQEYTKLLTDNEVTILNQTPRSFYNLQTVFLPRNSSTPIRTVIFAGEALSPIRLREWKIKYPSCKLLNLYGITETTIHTTYKEITISDIENGISNIGTALPTLECLILDDQLRQVPFGVIGELYVGGPGIAIGYLNRPDLTMDRFIAHPTRSVGENRLYRSGDLGVLLPNGEIKYAGRKDSQVKIRGHRIELGEVESAIDEHAFVEQSAVIAHTDQNDNTRLIAYIVVSDQFDRLSLDQHLDRKLPSFMHPQATIVLPSMQLTGNGKIDKKQLPEFDPNSLTMEDDFVAPDGEIEEFVAGIWTSILGIEKISTNQDFFKIGGDSLSGIRVITSINDELELELPVNLIFQKVTIRDMAANIEQTIKLLMSNMENETNS